MLFACDALVAVAFRLTLLLPTMPVTLSPSVMFEPFDGLAALVASVGVFIRTDVEV